jgi:hypothetical protein
MDAGSKDLAKALDAFAQLCDQLRSFGYKLYVEHRARSWTQPRSVMFYRKGTQPDTQPAMGVGFAIWGDRTGRRSITFGIGVGWNGARWSVQASVEDEDGWREPITELLWESEEYEATTVDELIESLQLALQALTSSVNDPRVSAYLASIERRT